MHAVNGLNHVHCNLLQNLLVYFVFVFTVDTVFRNKQWRSTYNVHLPECDSALTSNVTCDNIIIN